MVIEVDVFLLFFVFFMRLLIALLFVACKTLLEIIMIKLISQIFNVVNNVICPKVFALYVLILIHCKYMWR